MSKSVVILFKQRLKESTKKEVNEISIKDPCSNVEKPDIPGIPLGADDVPGGIPVELSGKFINTDTLEKMQSDAVENVVNAKSDNMSCDVEVSDIKSFDFNSDLIKYFIIRDNMTGNHMDYVVYQIDDKIYYRIAREFMQLLQDAHDKIPGITITSFKNKFDKIKEPLDNVYSVADRDDCEFVICSIFSSITGKSYDNGPLVDQFIDESCKIRKHTKLGTDNVFKKSVAADEAKYGTSDKKAFHREIEDKQKQDDTVGALDQQQQESAQSQPGLPNIHRKMMSEKICGVDIDAIYEARNEDIYYEPHDRVLVKTSNGEIPGMVTDVFDNLESGQVLTVMCQGSTVNVTSKEVKPDMRYLVNQLSDYTDEFSDLAFQIDKKTRLNKKVENDKKDYTREYKDMNDLLLGCDIVVNGFKVNYEPTRVSLKDIAKNNKYVKVVTESGGIDMWPIQNVTISEENWPYAVVVSATDDENEPQRKIKINPTSYVEADEEDLVDCILGGQKTQIAKKYIKIIT